MKSIAPFNRSAEKEIQQFWSAKKIYEKARSQSLKQKKKFYFHDGPPYATGHIHMGTALNKVLKDVAMRSMRMQGFAVHDRPGYDSHGLPIENKVEKALGFKTKQDIERFGVKPFVEQCKDFASEHIDDMNCEFASLGVWMDWKNAYITYTDDYMQAIWWTFKKAEEKKLLYLGKYSVHVCPHCETAVAYNEIEYAKQTDNAVYVKFPVVGKPNVFLVIWTTTPWTLPGNAGVMAHPEFDYAQVQLSNGEQWILAKERVDHLMNAIEAGYSIVRTFKGKEMDGWKYANPLSKHLRWNPEDVKDAYRVILSARYVNLDDGTGLVHCAPGHGKEDFDAGSRATPPLPVLCPVGMNGLFTQEGGKYAGKRARVVDSEIVEDLKEQNALVYSHAYSHDYPLCWRCKTPLLMLATPQWWFKISAIQKELLKQNGSVNWVPAWMKDRMKNWLESLGDWPISRERYWGTPLPIWVCESGQHRMVVGSVAELKQKAIVWPKHFSMHKPEIDEVVLKCDRCGKRMNRVPEVLDVWFDAGASSWAALQFPEKNEEFKRFWPANLVLEGTDQVRGWWNAQLILSQICFDRKPFDNVLVHGLVLDVSRIKMSKSLGNTVSPLEIAEQHSADFLRFYFAATSKGGDFSFDDSMLQDVQRFFNTFWNSVQFAQLYLKPTPLEKVSAKKLEPEDEWLLSKAQSLVETVTKSYDEFHYPEACASINRFVVEDLSRTYIKLIRDRVGSDSEKSLNETLSYALYAVIRLLAPLCPHASEHAFQGIRSSKDAESVHLASLPLFEKKYFNPKLEEEMDLVQSIAPVLLSLREENKLRLRWKLKNAFVKLPKEKKLKFLLPILAKMANVENAKLVFSAVDGNVAVKDVDGMEAYLDLAVTPEMEEQWELAELLRKVQDLRKRANLQPGKKAKLFLDCNDEKFLKKHAKTVESETSTTISRKKGKMDRLLKRDFFIELAS